jgi:hypothetical protein
MKNFVALFLCYTSVASTRHGLVSLWIFPLKPGSWNLAVVQVQTNAQASLPTPEHLPLATCLLPWELIKDVRAEALQGDLLLLQVMYCQGLG